MADIFLKIKSPKLPDEIIIYIHKIIHEKRLKKVHNEFFEIIYKTFKSNSFNSIGTCYMTCMRFNNNIYLGTSEVTFLTNLMWNEFWCEYSHFKKNPKRNLSPMILHKITEKVINSNKPYKCCSKKWLS